MTLNEGSLEKRLSRASQTQESIQSLSYFCLHYEKYHERIVQIWLKCLQKAKVSHRLTLIYLANDIVQNAKRKNKLEFIKDFTKVLKYTIPYLKDPTLKNSVERVFSIWQDRTIFDPNFTTELKLMLNSGSRKESAAPVEDMSTTPPLESAPQTSSSINSVLTPLTATAVVTPTQSTVVNPRLNQINQTVSNNSTPSKISNNSSNQHNIVDCLAKLSSLEKTIESLDQNGRLVDKLTRGDFSNANDNALDELRTYVYQLKCEIDERSKLSGMIEQYLDWQKKLLIDSENELMQYKFKLEYVTKLKQAESKHTH